MTGIALPIGIALFCWWFGTGIVFLLERAMRGRRSMALAGITLIGALSLLGVMQSRLTAGASGAYLGFASSIALWGALELSFLTGLVTGPRGRPCPGECRGWRHFGHAVVALLHHELALACCAAALVAICWSQVNPTAACTFGLLWVMRESAKLNLFLGVRNPAVELLPERLAHLACYFGSSRINPLLPVSIVAATVADALLVRQALAPAASGQDRVSGMLLATLLALAILEHLVLVLPVRADALWTWATRRNGRGQAPPAGGATSGCSCIEPEATVRGPAVPLAVSKADATDALPPGAPA